MNNKTKLVAWLSVLGVLAVTAIVLFTLGRSATHAASPDPNRLDMTSVTADQQGRARGDITYTCQPGGPVVNVLFFVEDHDAGMSNGVGTPAICDSKVHKIALFISDKDGKRYALRDHTTATAALTDKMDTAVGNAAFDKEDVTL